MKNEIKIRGKEVDIFLNRKDGTHLITTIDIQDLEKVNTYPGTWVAIFNRDLKSFYAAGNFRISPTKRTTVMLHRYLLDAGKGLEIDHRNHDTLDNKRDNLRTVTHSQNMQNRLGATAHNKSSGIRGVTWVKGKQKWRSSIRINKKEIFLGYFADIKEAENVAINARQKHMPFSREAANQ